MTQKMFFGITVVLSDLLLYNGKKTFGVKKYIWNIAAEV